MHRTTRDLFGLNLAATDGEIGLIEDFFIDDQNWAVRYLVVDTGSWLAGSRVLISPHAVGRLDLEERTLSVNLTRQQIEGAPSIESHRPVSRQYEIDYHRYYRWRPYWNGGAMWGLGSEKVATSPDTDSSKVSHLPRDNHLRSVKALKGYAVHATDAKLGTLCSFIVDDKNWGVHKLIVETDHWIAGKEIQIPAAKVKRISYEDSTVSVDLSEAEIAREESAMAKPIEELLWPGSTAERPKVDPPQAKTTPNPRGRARTGDALNPVRNAILYLPTSSHSTVPRLASLDTHPGSPSWCKTIAENRVNE